MGTKALLLCIYEFVFMFKGVCWFPRSMAVQGLSMTHMFVHSVTYLKQMTSENNVAMVWWIQYITYIQHKLLKTLLSKKACL